MVRLRKYQQEALSALKNNQYQGIFDMATGTGKTFTSISCANQFYEETGKQFLIVLVPFLHLIPQWKENLSELGITTQVEVANARNSWSQKLKNVIYDFDHGYRDRVAIIGSYKSTNSPLFGEILSMLKHKDQGFLIADECHYLGSESAVNLPVYQKIGARLGLSATPQRWWDEEGTAKIYNLFKKVAYEYSLEKAIANNFLTHYNYYPVPITLTFEENEEYVELSKKISQLALNGSKESDSGQDAMKRLELKRSRLLQSAKNKRVAFKEIFCQHAPDYSLVYCPDGEIKEFTKMIGLELHARVHKFNADVSYKERITVLKNFAENQIQTLTANKCLDEGVDVPATKVAYFISSTTNPRQFIQRRGRILRKDKASGKNKADIYDLIVVPDEQEMDINMARKMVKSEMPRFHEFSKYADNEFEARQVVQPILSAFDLDAYMDKSAWEVYEETQAEWEEK